MVLFIYICCHSFSFFDIFSHTNTHTQTFANLLTSTLTEYSQSLFFFRRAINKYVYCVHNKETHTYRYVRTLHRCHSHMNGLPFPNNVFFGYLFNEADHLNSRFREPQKIIA